MTVEGENYNKTMSITLGTPSLLPLISNEARPSILSLGASQFCLVLSIFTTTTPVLASSICYQDSFNNLLTGFFISFLASSNLSSTL